MSDSIEILAINGTWHAKRSGAGRQKIIDLFGTDTLPTPYSTSMSVMAVLRDIQARNPECEVFQAVSA